MNIRVKCNCGDEAWFIYGELDYDLAKKRLADWVHIHSRCEETDIDNPPFTCEPTLNDSFRVHISTIVEYLLRGPGRRIVSEKIYLAAWEIEYALRRMEERKGSNEES